jgi:hypothetical protein
VRFHVDRALQRRQALSFIDDLAEDEAPAPTRPPCDGCGRTDWVACLEVAHKGKVARICADCARGGE